MVYTALKYFTRTFAVKLLRLFSQSELKKDYNEWLKKSSSYKSKNKFCVRIDGTKTGKKYGKKIPNLKLLYDYVNACKINTHSIYLMLASIGNKDYIVDFHLVKKKKEGWNCIAIRMINVFIRFLGKKKQTLNHVRLSLDGAYGNGEMLSYLKKKGFKHVSIKSGGKDLVLYDNQSFTLKYLESHLSKEADFISFNPCHKLKGSYCSVIVKLEKKDFLIRVLLRRFTSVSKGYRYLMILSTNIDVQEVKDFQIAQCYKCRWCIEDCIKSNKQITKIEKYSYHSEKPYNIELFLSLRFCLYMILNWYQVEYCRPGITSLYKVESRFINYFKDIGYKNMWKLFSG